MSPTLGDNFVPLMTVSCVKALQIKYNKESKPGWGG